MKFIVSSTELLSHLQAISRVVDSKNYYQNFEDFQCPNFEMLEFDYLDYTSQLLIAKPSTTEINELKKGAIKELLRRLSLYLSNNTATQLLRTQNSIYSDISLFFGLCCSRPSYIFSAIFGATASRIFSTVPVLN